MLKSFYILATFFVFSNIYAQQKIDVLHYKYAIALNDVNDTIYGQARIHVKFLSSSNTVEFDLVNVNSNGKGMHADKATGTFVKGVTHLTDKIQLQLAKEAKAGDTATFTIVYKGIPADGLIISKNKYGRRTFFADNWPNRGHNWLPCADDPADKAAVEFIVTAPQHYQVVANGLPIEETNLPDNKKRTHWKEDVPISTKVMVIGVAEFAVNLSGIIDGCIPVYSWVYPEDRDKGFFDYAQAAEILPWFIKNVGPYAYKKLANVESKTIFGGLENANTIFYSENSISGVRNSESLIAHEIAHQWFGNMATEKTFAHLWLSEGFATYMTTLYIEQKKGSDFAKTILEKDRNEVIEFAKTSNRTVVDNDTNYMELLNPNSYQKGGWILHMLRRQLGDSIFWKSIRTYYSTYAGKTADTDDLRKVFEKVSGKDLSTFFKQWLFTPGIPDLKITWKYLASQKKLAVTIEQLQPYLFNTAMEFAITTSAAKPIIQKINLSKKTETFTFSSLQKPVSISADPNTSLLFTATIAETK